MENPSLRVSGHVSSMNRTFIVEDYAEDDFGQWAKDEVTGELMKDRVSGHGTTLSVPGSPRPPGDKKKRKGKKENTKENPEEAESKNEKLK